MAKCCARNAVTKRGIASVKSLTPRTMRMPASSGCFWCAIFLRMRTRNASAPLPAPQHFDLHDERTVEYRRPSGFGGKFRYIQSRFLFELALHTCVEIDLAIHDVVGVGGPARKINAAGLRRMLAHDAEQERAVGADNGGSTKAIMHAHGRAPPSAPGGEARIVGFQVGAAKPAVCQRLAVQHQNAAVPYRRDLAL